jgi:hypothetical protein
VLCRRLPSVPGIDSLELVILVGLGLWQCVYFLPAFGVPAMRATTGVIAGSALAVVMSYVVWAYRTTGIFTALEVRTANGVTFSRLGIQKQVDTDRAS